MPKLTQGRASAATTTIWCSEMPGFGLRVHGSGRRVYVVRYRTVTGRQRLLTLGRASAISADQARALAREAFAAVARGEDPAGDRRSIREAPTIARLHEVFTQLHMPMVKPASRKVYAIQWRQRILPAWRARSVRDISRADVVALVGKAAAHSQASANIMLATLKRAFSIALELGWVDANPAAGVKSRRLPGRGEVLTVAQLATIDATITAMLVDGSLNRPQADLFRLLALTGCRRCEVMNARRDWVDAERRLLVLPDSKTGQRHIALPARALAIIQAMPPSPWLIPGEGGRGPMRQPMAAWRRVLARAGLPGHLRLHDLRHTFGSHGHQQGLSQRQIADLLGHADLSTTARYLHGVQDSGPQAVDVVAERVSAGWSDGTLAS